MSAPTSRALLDRRMLLRASAGMAGILATGRAPAFAQTRRKNSCLRISTRSRNWPRSRSTGWRRKSTAQSKGALDVQFFGKTLIPQELEIMNAVKSGTSRSAARPAPPQPCFPRWARCSCPIWSRTMRPAYAMFNGRIGDKLDKEFQDKYKLKVLCYLDFGFRHFWTAKKPIVEPKDLRGMKIRVQQAKVFGDTINGLGGNAVPMALGEVITAAKQGVIDGGDLPIVNMKALKIYDVSKYASLTYPQLRPDQRGDEPRDLERPVGDEQEAYARRRRARPRTRIREATESVDNFAKAKSELEPLGMTVVRGQCRGIPQGRAAEDLAGLQEPVRRAVGRDRRLQGLTLLRLHREPKPRRLPGPSIRSPLRSPAPPRAASSTHMLRILSAVPEVDGHGADRPRDHQPPGRRHPALFRRRHHRLARRRPGAVHLGRGSRRDGARLADPDRRGDRRAAARAFHAARVRAQPAGGGAALDPSLQSCADRRHRRARRHGTATSSACSTARSRRPAWRST